jgi:hypothetical protein
MTAIALERRGAMPIECYRFQYVGTSTALARWTSSDSSRDISIAAAIHPTGGDILETYLPAPIEHDDLEGSDEGAGTGVRVSLPQDDAETNPLVDLFRLSEPPFPVEMCLYRGHRGSGHTTRPFFGDVAGATFANGLCTLTVAPKQAALARRVLRQLIQAPCNNVLYDSFCGVNKASFGVAGTIDAIAADGVTLTVSEASAFADGYFGAAGLLEFSTRIGTIVEHVGDQLTLRRAVPGLIVGSAVTIYPGCKRDTTDCNVKFNNIANHMGFPFVPSMDPFKDGAQV